MFSIYDGREKLYQWDKDRKLIVEDETIKQVHFANCLCRDAKVCEVKDGLVDVPNELLTDWTDIRAWGYDGAATKHEQVFEVEKRVKPADYIYTPSDFWTAEKAVEKALEEAKESGDFKGDKGDKGDAGVIDFIVVTELPADGDGSKIYLLPNATGENNNFDEFIFQNGEWEKIGSAGVEVNLDEYVKNTDYATNSGASGVVRVNAANYGVGCNKDGFLYLAEASDADIHNWMNVYRPITPNNLDYAVKKALAHTNHTTWTNEEKAAARALLGTIEAKTSDRTSVYAVNSSGEQILVGTSPNAANNGMIPIYNKNGTINVGTPETSQQSVNKAYVEGLIADIESNIFVANPDTTWQEIDDAYSAGKYIFYALEQWGIMNIMPLCQRGTGDVYIFTHIRENKYLYTVKVNKDNTRGIGSTYVVDKLDFDALVARVEALEGK